MADQLDSQDVSRDLAFRMGDSQTNPTQTRAQRVPRRIQRAVGWRAAPRRRLGGGYDGRESGWREPGAGKPCVTGVGPCRRRPSRHQGPFTVGFSGPLGAGQAVGVSSWAADGESFVRIAAGHAVVVSDPPSPRASPAGTGLMGARWSAARWPMWTIGRRAADSTKPRPVADAASLWTLVRPYMAALRASTLIWSESMSPASSSIMTRLPSRPTPFT